jgi:serine acetyltransferase/GT2 family glycosyltransferase
VPDSPKLSVVIATYNRFELLSRLLRQLEQQSLPREVFEVVVVDDGSAHPVGPELDNLGHSFALRCLTQRNAGPAAARHAGIAEAKAETLVLLDDDMEIPPEFLAAHLAHHPAGTRRVVLGYIKPAPPQDRQKIFQRYHSHKIDHLGEVFQSGRERPRGIHLYTGNVSMRRADYLKTGGLDPALRRSEDVELGTRLEQIGAEFVFAPEAFSIHHCDHADALAWHRDSRLYGHFGLRISHKHPGNAELHPYRFMEMVNPLSLPLLATSLFRPALGQRLASVALAAAALLDRLHLEAPALKTAGFVHGLDYFSGVGEEAGSPAVVLFEGLRFLAVQWASDASSPELFKWLGVAAEELAADYAIALESRPTYGDGKFLIDLTHRIGLQIMTCYRLMRALRRADQLLAAKAISRLIRHVYGADIHWNTEIGAGVHIVHGMGMALSPLAEVGPGSVLSHHVTLGEGLHPTTRQPGAPKVGARVSIGPGATLLGPITIGDKTKIMPGVVLMESVPPGSIVEAPEAVIKPRRKHDGAAAVRPAERAEKHDPQPRVAASKTHPDDLT